MTITCDSKRQLNLYRDFRKETTDGKHQASKGFFQRFRNRHNLKNIKLLKIKSADEGAVVTGRTEKV